MILNNKSQEMMINLNTGKMVTVELTKKEKGIMILRTNTSEEEKIYALEAIGFTLTDILELALELGFTEDKEAISYRIKEVTE